MEIRKLELEEGIGINLKLAGIRVVTNTLILFIFGGKYLK
jgi:hypothetical protein